MNSKTIANGSYLVYGLKDEFYAINVLNIKSSIEVPSITKFPNMPSHILGVFDNRGIAIPAILTHHKLKIPKSKFTPKTCILILETNIESI